MLGADRRWVVSASLSGSRDWQTAPPRVSPTVAPSTRRLCASSRCYRVRREAGPPMCACALKRILLFGCSGFLRRSGRRGLLGWRFCWFRFGVCAAGISARAWGKFNGCLLGEHDGDLCLGGREGVLCIGVGWHGNDKPRRNRKVVPSTHRKSPLRSGVPDLAHARTRIGA